MEHAIPIFLQYGAMGIMALGFVVLLVLFVRSDKRSQKYADRLDEASFDRGQLIKVVIENTKSAAALTGQIAETIKSHEKTCAVIDRLERRLATGKCPLLGGQKETDR